MIVMAFGTFDLLHQGHVNYLEAAKQLGDKLVVIIARDDTILKIKKQEPVFSQEERAENLRKLSFVNKVLVGYDYFEDKLRIVEEVKPNIICLGYDQKISEEELKKELKSRDLDVKVIRMAPFKPEIYKSSKLRETIKGKPKDLPLRA